MVFTCDEAVVFGFELTGWETASITNHNFLAIYGLDFNNWEYK